MLRMRRQTILVPVWVILGSLVGSGHGWSRDGFIDSVLNQYRQTDQASRADTARDGVITEGEFVFSLYRQADARGNNDNQVSREEFLDYYNQLFNISSELGTIMFDYLNDPASRDDVITTSDVSLSSFAGRTYATVAEYKEGLEKWLRQSLEKLYSILMSPHVISQDRKPVPNYKGMITSMDTNKDGVISISELNQELKRFNPNQPASRTDWVWRNSQRYDGKYPDVSSLAFDFYDRDGDLKLTSRDLQLLAENMDYNGDGRIKKDESLRFMERAYSLSQRMTGRPMSLPLIKCPQPWWSEFESLPSMDALRAAVDFDDDLDGWITAADLRRWLDIFDSNDNSEMDVNEFSNFNMERYRVNSSIAQVMFALADVNGDQRLNEKDWEFHFKDDFALSLCDARRSLLDLARMAEKFQGSQLTGRPLRSAMQRKLQEEWTWYQQRRGGGWGGSSMFGGGRDMPGRTGGAGSRGGTCQNEDLCYSGEYTEAWGRPGAWMWWGMKAGNAAGFGPGGGPPGGRFPGQGLGRGGGGSDMGNMFPGGPSSFGGMGMPFFAGAQSTPLGGGGGNRPPLGQFQFSNLPSGSDAGMDGGMMSHFMPFKRNVLVNSADPDSSPGPKRAMPENYFTHYQKLFTPFVREEKTAEENHNSGRITSSAETNKLESQPTANNIFQTPKQNSISEPGSTQKEITTTETLTPPPETPKTSFTESKNKGNVDDFDNVQGDVATEDEFPFMGYPVFIGFDPWLLGAAPAWGMVGRMKRGEEDLEKAAAGEGMNTDTGAEKEATDSTRSKRDVSSKSTGQSSGNVPFMHSITPIPSTPPMPSTSGGDAAGNDGNAQGNGTDLDGFGDMEQGAWPAMVGQGVPPLAFGIPHLDFWTAMMLENAMMNNGGWAGDEEWLDSLNETMQDSNETLTGMKQWWLPEPWATSTFDESSSPMGDEGGLSENSDEPQDKLNGRRKRFAMPNMYRGYYSPNYFSQNYFMRMRMMANMMRYRRFYPNNFRMMFRYPWSYQFPRRNWQWQSNWYPYMNRWYRWSPYSGSRMSPRNYWMKRRTENSRWKGVPQMANPHSNARSKREAEELDRNKRWQAQGWYPSGNNWNWQSSFGNYQWPNQWSNAWMSNGFWKRNSKEGPSDGRSTRETQKNSREKRWEKLMWLPTRYISAHWKRFTDFKGPVWEIFNRMNQWPFGNWMNSGGFGNFMKREAPNKEEIENVKREADAENREKRWESSGYDQHNWDSYFQLSGFNPMPWNMHNTMNPWPGNGWSNFRKRDSQEETSHVRPKRESLQSDRDKRWQDNYWNSQSYNWNRSPQFYPSNRWQNRGWGMNQWSNGWSGRRNWNSFWKRGAEEKAPRSKRETDIDERTKRWQSDRWYPETYDRNRWQQYAGWGNNRWGMHGNRYQMPRRYGYNRLWNGSWKRDTGDEERDARQKRETANESNRNKRNSMMWQNRSPYWSRGWSQWRYPYMNQGWGSNWSNDMMRGNMYKRRSEDGADKRSKRSSDSAQKQKRQGMMWGDSSPYWHRWSSQWNSPYGNWQNQRQSPYYSMWKRNTNENNQHLRTRRNIDSTNRQRRYGMMWNFRSPYWNRWSSQWYSPYYNWFKFQRFYNNMPFWFNSGNRMWKRSSDGNPKAVRTRRDTDETGREKRFGMWNRQWNSWPSQWGWSSNNWGSPYMSGYGRPGNYMWKRGTEEDQETPRAKRDTENGDRQKRYGMMSNNWNSQPWQWSYPYNNWQMQRYWNHMWKRDTDEDSETTRTKRDTEQNGREKRFGMWNRQWNSWPSQWGWSSNNWGSPYMSGYGMPGNYMWKRGTEDKPETSRSKRDTESGDRQKRYGMMSNNWNSQPWQWSYPYNSWQMQRWWNRMWKRDTDENSETTRSKRDTEETGREKRFGMWNRQWNSLPSQWGWYSNNMGSPYMSNYGMPGNYMWKRGTVEDSKIPTTKRDTESGDRQKRYGMMLNYWNSQPWQWSYPNNNWQMQQWWNRMWKRDTDEDLETTRSKRDTEETGREKRFGMWNRQWNRWPSQWGWSSNNWGSPHMSNYGMAGNYMWKRETEEDTEKSRTKRDTEATKRQKRYGMMSNYRNFQPWQWSYPNNNWQMQQWWNRMWKRDTGEDSETTRTKRDTEQNGREKRFGMWNRQWNSWPSQWGWSSNNWGSPYMSGYGMPGNYMWKRGTEDKPETSRSKRDTESGDRQKRYGMMSNNWNSQPWQWSYPYNNWQMQRYWNRMWKRDTDEDSETTRTKRDTEQNGREKRFGMWNRQWNSWPAQWGWSSNNWGSPYMSGYGMPGNYMWKRGTEDKPETSRSKRDTESGDRQKRYGMMSNNWNSQPWQWSYPYNSWQMQRWWNRMWKRDTDENSETTRSKRDTEETGREKRFGMWNRQWNSLPSQWGWYSNNMGSPYMSNYGMPGNYMWKRGTVEDSKIPTTKRDTESGDRQKRYGMMLNYWNSQPWQWSYPNNNWQMQQWWNRMWKRDTDEDLETTRSKRDTEETGREKRFGMWNRQWNRWPSQWGWSSNNWGSPHMSNYGMAGNYMWKRETEEDTEKSRTKRDTEATKRQKRYGMMSNYRNFQPWQWSYPNNNWQMQQWWNRMWKRDTGEDSETTRTKRDTEQNGREKRFGMWNRQWNSWPSQWGWSSNNWGSPYMSGYGMPGNYMWKRGTEDKPETSRSKRDTESGDRQKRYGMMSNNWNSQPWQWSYPYNNWQMQRYWNHMWKRDTDEDSETTRTKRDTEQNGREKRFGMWNRQWNSWPSQWGWSSNNWGSPYMSGYGMPGNYMWKRGTEDKPETSRSKRDTESGDRQKRYGMMSNNWNSQPWQWSYPYNNWQMQRYWNRMWKRDTDEDSETTRTKRDTEQNGREKRFGMWNRQWNSWPSQWGWSSNNWGSPYMSGYGMPGNYMWKRGTEEKTETSRSKRDTESGDRQKRYGMMSNNWNSQPWQWSYPYNNWQMQRWWNQMWKRDTEENSETTRSKRDTEETGREKRFGMWNRQWNSLPSQWGWYSNNRWSPYMSNYGMPGNYMWKRGSRKDQKTPRVKRDTENGDREKRYGMMSKNWNSQPWQWSYPYNNWQMQRYWNHMWKRDTDEESETTRTKRDTEQSSREKRFGMWNRQWNSWPSQWGWSSNNWGSPYMSNYGMPGNYMWKRDTEEDTEKSRTKRETEATDRQKRYGMMSNNWNSQPWQWSYPYNNWQMQRWWNHMWKRDADEDTETTRTKRDTEQNGREKRFGMQNRQWNSWPSHWGWYFNNWGSPYMSGNGMSGNYMWKRDSDEDQETSRTKRDAEATDRQKRYGMMPNYWNSQPWQWSHPYNNWQMQRWWNRMWKRDTDEDSQTTRTKRDTEQNGREKRFGMWNRQWNSWPSQWGWSSNNWGNPYMSGSGMQGNYMWKRGTEEESETSRSKRGAESGDRQKRYGMMSNNWNSQPWQWSYPYNNWQMQRWWNRMWKRETDDKSRIKRDAEVTDRQKRYGMMSNDWNSQPWQWSYPYNNWQMGQWWNRMWKRSNVENSETTRSKRDTEETGREKRFGMWNRQWNSWPFQWGWSSNNWGSPYMSNYGMPGNYMWKRGSEKDLKTPRVTRDTETGERQKRYGMMSNNWNSQPWQWSHPYNWPMQRYWNRMWKRDTDEDSETTRTKRDTEQSSREKRFGMWNRQWNSWPSQWGWSSNNWGSPYMSNYGMPGNYMWKRGTEEEPEKSRSKRDTESGDRQKRYGMMSNNWNSQPWQWSYPYNNWQMQRWWNRMWKRDTNDNSRVKRNTEAADRQKRYGMMSNNWNSQPWQWSYPYNNWQMQRWWNHMWKRDTHYDTDEDSETTRSKRDTEETGREKRFGMWNRQGNRWPSQWGWSSYNWGSPHMSNYGMSGNYMWKRDSDEDLETSRTKRDTEVTDRHKRYGMMSNYWNSQPWQWSYPNNNWQIQQWWNRMWKRDNDDTSRVKRDTEVTDRQKRYGMMWNSGSNYWNRQPWQWPYPSSFRQMGHWWDRSKHGNQMWKRGSEADFEESKIKRSTRDRNRQKRYGIFWNFMSPYWNKWPVQWHVPYYNWWYQRWRYFNGMPSWFNYGHHMWKRDTQDIAAMSRVKRDTTYHMKRQGDMWNFGGPWQMHSSSSTNYMKQRWDSHYGNFGVSGSHMSKRDSGDNGQTQRTRRDTGDAERRKRFGTMWNSGTPWQWNNPYSSWNMHQSWPSTSGMSNWHQMWKRATEDSQNEPREIRDIRTVNRNKRYGMMWNPMYYYWSRPWNWFYSNWYPHYMSNWSGNRNPMWKRDTKAVLSEIRMKRDTDNVNRERRQGRYWNNWPRQWGERSWHRFSPYGDWQMGQWNRQNRGQGWFNNRNQMWKREEQENPEGTRNKRDTSGLGKEKWNFNMNDRAKAEPNKRQFAFDKNASPSTKSRDSEDSVWRSAKNKYGQENSWQRRLNQGNSKWQHGSNKNYGFTTNKWTTRPMPNTHHSNTGSWMQNSALGRGYSSQGNPGMPPSRGFGGSNGMPNMVNSGQYDGMSRGNNYDQSYPNQMGGAFSGDGFQGMSNYMPMDWGSNFAGPSFGMYGSNPMSMRYFREIQSKRETQDIDSVDSVAGLGDDESASNLRQKRDTSNEKETLEREKRYANFFNGNFFNPMRYFERYNRMRQMWAPWFFFSFCQRQPWWGWRAMNRYQRNATKSDKDNAFLNTITKTPVTQWLDSEKEKRQGQFYSGQRFGRQYQDQNWYWNRNRNQQWQYYNWMCPQAWSIMQRSFQGPSSFYNHYNGYNFFQGMSNPNFYYQRHFNRWKRSSPERSSAASADSSANDGYDDLRGRRQWGNFMQGWPRGHGPDDCEEWVAPMPAWSPWRGWNMLRKTRHSIATDERVKRDTGNVNLPDADTKWIPGANGNKEMGERESSESEGKYDEQGKRAAHRCRIWRGRNFDSSNMNMAMAMGSRMPYDRQGMGPWRNNWMGGNRWDSGRYRREAASDDASADVDGNKRERRWQSDMWYPGSDRPWFYRWNPMRHWWG